MSCFPEKREAGPGKRRKPGPSCHPRRTSQPVSGVSPPPSQAGWAFNSHYTDSGCCPLLTPRETHKKFTGGKHLPSDIRSNGV